MEYYLCGDLYEGAFLMCCGARFNRVKEYYKNHKGKSFSILEFENVTLEMLEKLHNENSSVNYQKFKDSRKKLKLKIEKFAQGKDYTELSSKQVYSIHKELDKQYDLFKKLYKSSVPKRVIYDNSPETT
jgi:hypothetical protein